MSVLTSYSTKYLLTFYLTANHTFSSDDLYIGTTFYARKLLNEPALTKQMENFNWGQSINIELNNSDGYFTNLFVAEELRYKPVKLERYEPLDSPTTAFEFYGYISDFNILDVASFTVTILDPDILQTLLPKKLYETTDWSETPPNIINPSYDLGKAYSLCFGYCKKVPLRYGHANFSSDYYDYIIGSGIIESNNNNKATTTVVYRSQTIINNTLYYLHGGETTIQYTDVNFGMSAGAANPYIKNGISYAFVRFKLEQIDFQGSPYEIDADIRGLKMGGSSAQRNFARVIQNILSDSLWGLNQSINTTSFNAAATALDTIADMYCDGHVSEQMTAQDMINYLLEASRGSIEKNESGEWIITIDTYQSSTSTDFGDKDSGKDNIISTQEYKKTSTTEAVRNLSLQYAFNQWENTYTYKNTRSINSSFGEDKAFENPFVRNHITADKITCYKQRLEQYGDTKLVIEVGMEGRALTIMNTITVNISRLQINSTFQIREIERNLTNFILHCISYNSAIYTYSTGTLPNDANSDNLDDFSITPPDPPTNFAIDSSGTYLGPDGYKSAYVMLKADIPASNATKLIYGYRKYGESIWTMVDGQLSSGSTWKVRIDGLMQATGYDYIVIASNSFDVLSTGNPSLTNQTSSFDSSAPATPTGLTAVVGTGKSVSLNWNFNTEDDMKAGEYRIYRNTTGNPPVSGDKIADVNANRFVDINVVYGTTYYYWVSAIDSSENESTKAGSVNATPTIVASVDVDNNGPAAPTSFTRTGEGVYQSSDGKTLAYETFSWTNPTTYWKYTNLLYRRNGSTEWNIADQTIGITGKIDDLIPGINYDFAVQGISAFGVLGTLSSTVSRVAPGDTTAPAQVTGATGFSKLKTWHFQWTPNTEDDIKGYHVQIATDSGFSNIIYDNMPSADSSPLGATSTDYTNDSQSFGTLYCRVKAVDFTGNQSASWSTTASTTTTQINTNDVADFALNIAKLFIKIPVPSADSWTDNSPTAEYVAWNAHTLYFNGVAYSIAAGNSNLKYIYWVFGNSSYSASDTNPALNDTDFVIATNISGIHDLAWNAIANEIIGYAYIQNGIIDAAKINNLRAVNVTASMHMTKGSYLTAATVGADTTVYLKDTEDFPSSGSGWFIDSTNDRDEFNWTGKTTTTLTGCSGVLAHNNGCAVIPKVECMVIDDDTNEMRFFGDRGDGTIEELASIGIEQDGTDYAIVKLGNINSSRATIVADGYAIFRGYVSGVQKTSVQLVTSQKGGVFEGQSYGIEAYGNDVTTGRGVKGAGQKYGIEGRGLGNGAGGKFAGSGSGGNIVLEPYGSGGNPPDWTTEQGTILIKPVDTHIFLNTDGATNWKKIPYLYSPFNLLKNGSFESWNAGTSAPPDGWDIWQVTISRDGTNKKLGSFGCALTSNAGVAGWIYASYARQAFDLNYLSGRKLSFGCWVESSNANRVCVLVSDYNGSSWEYTSSSYHSGSGNWEFLTVTKTFRPGLTDLWFSIYIVSGVSITCYCDGAIACEDEAPYFFVPNPVDWGENLPLIITAAPSDVGKNGEIRLYSTGGARRLYVCDGADWKYQAIAT